MPPSDLVKPVLQASVIAWLAATWCGPVTANEPPAAPAKPRATVPAAPLPQLQPGLWEYKRTVTSVSGKPQTSSIRKCTNPSADMEQKIEALKKHKCRFTPVQQTQDRYAWSWVCPTPQGAVNFHDVLIAKSATAYEDVSESRIGPHTSQQRIQAQRVGECPTGAPAAPPRKAEH